MQQPVAVAKVVLTSSLITLLVLMGILFVFRSNIAAYLISETNTSESGVVFSPDESIVGAVKKVSPAVVSVVVTKDVPIYERYYETFNSRGFWGNFSIPRIRENGTEEKEVGGGTGFVVSPEGLVVTNQHVVADGEARYSILLDDGTIYAVTVLDSDPEIDIAILQITDEIKKPLTTVTFGDSNVLQSGQTVIAIGNALAEFQNSVSVGVISGLSRTILASDSLGRIEELHEIIQTDAAINPGNSGGPLLNIAGEVIGVNVAMSRGADNIGFAIPSALVWSAVESVAEYGEIVVPYLGVRYTNVTPKMATLNGLAVDYGALITTEGEEVSAVLPDSPAAKAGLIERDIITAINGQSLVGSDLSRILRTLPIEEVLVIEAVRANERILLEVVLEKKD